MNTKKLWRILDVRNDVIDITDAHIYRMIVYSVIFYVIVILLCLIIFFSNNEQLRLFILLLVMTSMCVCVLFLCHEAICNPVKITKHLRQIKERVDTTDTDNVNPEEDLPSLQKTIAVQKTKIDELQERLCTLKKENTEERKDAIHYDIRRRISWICNNVPRKHRAIILYYGENYPAFIKDISAEFGEESFQGYLTNLHDLPVRAGIKSKIRAYFCSSDKI